MAQPSDHYHACSNIEKGCECQNQPFLEGQDLYYIQQRLAPHWREVKRPTLKKILVACGIGLVLGLAVSGLLHSWRFFRRHTHARPPFPPEVGFPAPEDPPQLQCVHSQNWTDYFDQPTWSTEPYGAATSFSLPIDADSLYLLSRGANQLGNLKITQSNKESDVADVDIRVAYQSKDSLDLVTVCLIEGGGNNYGVSILTPPHRGHWSARRPLHIDVELTLPAAKEDNTLDIKSLSTHLPPYSQNVTGLSEDISFGKISLESVDGYIAVDSVTTRSGSFKTVNGDISGHFEGESLKLVTANGNIDATVTLLNHGGILPSKLMLRSANGHVASEVAMISDANASGKFDVDASSTNGFVDLAFTKSPVGSVLKAVATTTNGEVKVAIPSTYEGGYLGTTVVGKVFVMERDVEDPEGKGRHREIIKNRMGNRVEGTVYWVESDGSHEENNSLVKAIATTSSVNLVI
ncbi:hypothetical protein EV401DRAFT_642407 [Pisolithus croceorrhizus]|nr:hypothetical protein EV401DRAFT_642407 [Pisolithus croceorrhizus]